MSSSTHTDALVDDTSTVVVLTSIVQLLSLSASHLPKPESSDTKIPSPPPFQLDETVIIQCSSLSLMRSEQLVHPPVGSATTPTMTMTTTNTPTKDRSQAKDHAIQLLARPMTLVHRQYHGSEGNTMATDGVSVDAEIASHPSTTIITSIFTSVGRRMEQNVFASMALLIDRRLQAYTDVLTRQAAIVSYGGEGPPVTTGIAPTFSNDSSCGGVVHNGTLTENKRSNDVGGNHPWMETTKIIQSRGAQTEVHALTSHFQLLLPSRRTNTSLVVLPGTSNNNNKSAIVIRSSPIRYTVTMELHIPNGCQETGTKEKIVPITFSTNGFIKCKLLLA